MTTRSRLREWNTFLKDTGGAIFVEAAFVMPIMVLLIAGISEYGITLYQFHTLSTATGSAVRQLVISRGFSSPYDNVLNQFSTWAPNLNVTSSQITVSVADSTNTLQTCTDNASCKSALDTAAGRQASVAVNYACALTFIPKYASPCPIQISMTGLVE